MGVAVGRNQPEVFTFMKELDLVINKGGFTYTQVFKNDKGYIYSQSKNGIQYNFEAFLHRENNYFNCVSFPGNEAFGSWAWSCRTLERAMTHLK